MDKQEIAEGIEHQQEMLRILRKRLQQRERQAAQYGINVPPEIVIEISSLSESIRSHEAELKRLQSLAVEDQMPLAEVEYKVLLAQSWDTPHGRLSIANILNLELSRLRLGITPQQAKYFENQVRKTLAKESFYKIHYDMFTYENSNTIFNSNEFENWGVTFDVNQSVLQQFMQNLKLMDEDLTGRIRIDHQQIKIAKNEDPTPLQNLGRAICLDISKTVELFIHSLPSHMPNVSNLMIHLGFGRGQRHHDRIFSEMENLLIGQYLLPLDLSRFKRKLLEVNNVWVVQEELASFEQFINNLGIEIRKWKLQVEKKVQ